MRPASYVLMYTDMNYVEYIRQRIWEVGILQQESFYL